MQILNKRRGSFLRTCAETPKLLKICIIPFRYMEVSCPPCCWILFSDRCAKSGNFCVHAQKFLMVILDNSLPTLDYLRKHANP